MSFSSDNITLYSNFKIESLSSSDIEDIELERRQSEQLKEFSTKRKDSENYYFLTDYEKNV